VRDSGTLPVALLNPPKQNPGSAPLTDVAVPWTTNMKPTVLQPLEPLELVPAMVVMVPFPFAILRMLPESAM